MSRFDAYKNPAPAPLLFLLSIFPCTTFFPALIMKTCDSPPLLCSSSDPDCFENSQDVYFNLFPQEEDPAFFEFSKQFKLEALFCSLVEHHLTPRLLSPSEVLDETPLPVLPSQATTLLIDAEVPETLDEQTKPLEEKEPEEALSSSRTSTPDTAGNNHLKAPDSSPDSLPSVPSVMEANTKRDNEQGQCLPSAAVTVDNKKPSAAPESPNDETVMTKRSEQTKETSQFLEPLPNIEYFEYIVSELDHTKRAARANAHSGTGSKGSCALQVPCKS